MMPETLQLVGLHGLFRLQLGIVDGVGEGTFRHLSSYLRLRTLVARTSEEHSIRIRQTYAHAQTCIAAPYRTPR